jgi:cytochrome oxidase assembly protein ShyY1
MYRFLFRPKWILFHIVVLSSAIGMLGLARWQWNKHVERDAFTSELHQREQATPAELAPLLATKAPADIEYYTVSARGSYMATTQFSEINQVVDGHNGFNVLTPFQIDNGPIIIVNRGFVADGAKVPAAPSGHLAVGGLARTTEIRTTGQLTDNNDGAGNEVRRIDLPLLAKRLNATVAPVYITFSASDPASPIPPLPLPAPDLSGGPPHVSYTVQWCIFSLCALVGWVFAIRRSLRTRRLESGQSDPDPDPDRDRTVSEDVPALPSA